MRQQGPGIDIRLICLEFEREEIPRVLEKQFIRTGLPSRERDVAS